MTPESVKIVEKIVGTIESFVGEGQFNIKTENWSLDASVERCDSGGPLKVRLSVDPCQIDNGTVAMFQACLWNTFNIQAGTMSMNTIHSVDEDSVFVIWEYGSENYWYE